jgi:hypothetical protein
VVHPGLPEILHRFGDQAIREMLLQAASGDHDSRSCSLDSARSRRNKN